MSEEELIREIQKTLARIAQEDPTWEQIWGTEVLSASEAIERLNTDEKFREWMVKRYLSLAIMLEQWGREKREGT